MSSNKDEPSEEEITRFPLDWYSNFGLTAQSNAVRLARDKDGKLWGIVVTGFASNPASGTVRNYMPSAITDPTESATSGNSVARCFGSNATGAAISDATIGLVTIGKESQYSPPDGSAFNGGWVGMATNFKSDTTSAVATAQAVTLADGGSGLNNCRNNVDIISICSAGTATLVVEVSTDNTTWLQIDSIAAAATVVKHYDATVVGAGTYAVCPLGFPRIRITAGSAGAGNTTRLRIVAH